MFDVLVVVMVIALVLMCAFVIHAGIPGYDPRVRVRRPSTTRPSPETADGFGGARAYDSSVTYPMGFMKGPLPPDYIGGTEGDEHEAKREAEKAHR